jgi:3-oxoadipate enol-lactonase
MTGMWLARFAPERIDKLVLSNTGPKSTNPDSWNTRIRTVRAKGLEGVADGVLNIWFTKDFHARAPQAIAETRKMMVATNAQGYVGCCAALRDMDQRWGIADIDRPTLIIGGRQDMATPYKDSEFLASRIKGSQLVGIDAAHISNIEQPAAYIAALEKFLKG